MWDLIVSVPDHCLSFYFQNCHEFALSGGVNFNILTYSDSCHARIIFMFA